MPYTISSSASLANDYMYQITASQAFDAENTPFGYIQNNPQDSSSSSQMSLKQCGPPSLFDVGIPYIPFLAASRASTYSSSSRPRNATQPSRSPRSAHLGRYQSSHSSVCRPRTFCLVPVSHHATSRQPIPSLDTAML